MTAITPDPATVATQYGLPWGIVTGLAIYIFFFTVPKWLYLEAQKEKREAMEKLGTLVGDVRELLSLAKNSRGQ